MEHKLELLETDLEDFGIHLTEIEKERLLKYYELLMERNRVMNLTAITGFEEVMKKHFVDSLSLAKAVDLSGDITLIDVGTGAGFPGLVLKIVYPQLKITLLDSLNKRITFLKEVIEKLGLEEIEAIHGRAEDFAVKGLLREKFDLCVSRAVANLSTLSEYCLPYVKIGGKFVSYKSEKLVIELADAEKAIKILGGAVEAQKEFYLPNSDIFRNLVVVGKVKETPSKYPRKAGLPAKEPLTS